MTKSYDPSKITLKNELGIDMVPHVYKGRSTFPSFCDPVLEPSKPAASRMLQLANPEQWNRLMETERVRQHLIRAWPWILLGIRNDLAQKRTRITTEEFHELYGLDIPLTEEK